MGYKRPSGSPRPGSQGRLPGETVPRAYIPKPIGGNGRSGSPRRRTRVLQRAVAEVLNAIYENDSSGPPVSARRSPHHALDALAVGISTGT